MKPTGNYAWLGTNGIYAVEIEGVGYVPIFPKDYGYENWESYRAKAEFLRRVKKGRKVELASAFNVTFPEQNEGDTK